MVARAERHAGAGAQRRQGGRGLHAAARRGRARRAPSTRSRARSCCAAARTRKDVLDGVHEAVDAHQPRRAARRGCRSSRSTTARGSSTPRCTPSRTTCSRARCWSRWCCGCSCARCRGSFAVAVTMPLALLTAFVGLYYAGVPANLLVDGRDRLRHPARRRGDPGRERLPPPGRGAAAARRGARRRRRAPPRRWCGRRCSRCRSSSRR